MTAKDLIEKLSQVDPDTELKRVEKRENLSIVVRLRRKRFQEVSE